MPRAPRKIPRHLRCLAAACLLLPALAFAHGAKIDYKFTPAISLQAMYDSGEPMTAAQVTVYAPNDPTTPWMSGKTDKEGRFSFVPDPAIEGMWAVQAREAGHGALIQVAMGGNSATSHAAADTAASDAPQAPPAAMQTMNVSSQGQDPMQRWVMVACVVWGFIGTALFFARNTRKGPR